ncbi:MMPL family transporter [Lacticaseibacillus parakribbianus]|uniref:MMPL family transporter n=1 Tax=Lacticaseibacillus parakribbianus TaxID=2970927 RepID=UPI0021CB2947
MKRFLEHHIGALLAWLLIVIVAVAGMPDTAALVRERGDIRVPKTMQSQVATAIQNKWGKGQSDARQVAVVFSNGDAKLTASQRQSVAQTVTFLQNNRAKYHIKSIMAPSDNAETKKQLVAKDGTTQIVQLMVGKQQTVRQMTATLEKAVKTKHVTTYVTGADILTDDFNQATEAGIKKTEVIAAVFIFVVLILVFRSPVVPVISLATVGVSLLVSLSLVMNLVKFLGFPLSAFTQVFMVVILFGIGTDYNILLYDQFKEELAAGLSNTEAAAKARRVAGRTILYSGSSVLIGFSALGLAKFSIYQSAVGVAVGVAVLLVVLLTLNPFFMATMGKRLFWPTKDFTGGSRSRFWQALASRSVLHPLIALVLVALCAVPVLLGYNGSLNYDTVVELGAKVPAKQGFKVIQAHYSKGTAEPSTLYIQSDKKLAANQYLKVIDQLTRKLQQDPSIETVASVTQPGGSAISDLYVQKQLGTVTSGMTQARTGLGEINRGLQSASSQLAGADMASGLAGVRQLVSGTDQLLTGSKQLQSGTKQLATGANTLNQGVGQYTGAVAQLNAGTTQLAANSPQLEAGVTQLTQQTQALPLAVAGLTAYTTGINGGIAQINGALADNAAAFGQLAAAQTQMQALTAQTATMRTQLAAAQKLAPQLAAAIKLLDQLQAAKADLTALQTKATGLTKTLATVRTTMTQVALRNVAATAAERAIITQAQAIVADDTASAAAKKAAQAIVTKAQANLSDNLQANTKAISGVASQAGALTLPDLTKLRELAAALPSDDDIAELKSELQNAQALMQSAAGMLDQADALSGQTAKLGELTTALTQLQTGLKTLQTNSNAAVQIATQLNAGVNGSGVDLSSQKTIQNTIQNAAMTRQLAALTGGVSQYVSGVNQVASGTSQLAANATGLSSGAAQLLAGSQQLAANVPALTSGLTQERAGQQTMYNTLVGLTGQMTQLQTGLGSATAGLTQIDGGVQTANGYLTGLKHSAAAKEFYIPKAQLTGKAFEPALDQYLSKDQTATQLTLVFKVDPASAKAMAKVTALQKEVQNQLRGTALAGATVAIGGQTAFTADTRDVASSDFMRTAVIMLVGIALALMVVTRSLLQPVYILGTLLLAYFSSLTLTRLLSAALLGQAELTWNTPFFGFIMLIALGVDYSIFLMMKYREFGQELAPSRAMVQAAEIIGAVVISAAIILGGTFAALMPSGVLTLIQVAITVMIGLIILVVLLPIILSASVALTYDRHDA